MQSLIYESGRIGAASLQVQRSAARPGPSEPKGTSVGTRPMNSPTTPQPCPCRDVWPNMKLGIEYLEDGVWPLPLTSPFARVNIQSAREALIPSSHVVA